MPRLTVTSGGGSARYGSKCQACNGYGDIQKLRSDWLCMPCRMNKSTLLTPRSSAERKKDAQQQISDRRAANARAAAQAAEASKAGPLFRRRRNAVVVQNAAANPRKTGAAKKALKQQAPSVRQQPVSAKQPSRKPSTVNDVNVGKRSKQKPKRAQPAPETFESARTRLQQKWNTRLG